MIHEHLIAIVTLIFVGIGLITISGLYAFARDDQTTDMLHNRFDTMSNLACSFGLSAWVAIGLAMINPIINLDLIAVLYVILFVGISAIQALRDAKHFE